MIHMVLGSEAGAGGGSSPGGDDAEAGRSSTRVVCDRS